MHIGRWTGRCIPWGEGALEGSKEAEEIVTQIEEVKALLEALKADGG